MLSLEVRNVCVHDHLWVVCVSVSAWGPSVVLLLAVVLAYHLASRVLLPNKGVDGKGAHSDEIRHDASDVDQLRLALDSATSLNAFSVHSHSDPTVRLQQAVKVHPTSYDSATREILQHFRKNNIITVDLDFIKQEQAGRLVDFCSGATAIRSGWIFRVTDKVIVITPVGKLQDLEKKG